jgi:hypothetical protein
MPIDGKAPSGEGAALAAWGNLTSTPAKQALAIYQLKINLGLSASVDRKQLLARFG